jgi:acetoin utilization protein AcuA
MAHPPERPPGSKPFFQKTVTTPLGETVIVEGPVTSEALESWTLHEGLRAFRPPERQHAALVRIAQRPEARIIVARIHHRVVGYVTFLYPDPLERWAEIPMPDLLELGAIEVCAPYRGCGIAKSLLAVAFMDDAMNDYIVISTEYYWHWDLEGTGLSVWEYKEVMKKVMGSVGMEYYSTDDPEITSHPANMLMARIGSRVPRHSVETFDKLRFRNKFFL